ncbi:hypothetical protein VP01_1237g10 [Puccinia sorghi]|uniref:Uncharacterized protein n=1 Tax=Puccinia sorghi TaxID=27349 RepID=A0A0L6VPN7_9BASI|nr:hypothetical protein VP01_1237g10 [Puccinia sorghi]
MLKRTASRAELDRRQDHFTHSQPPPPLPTRENNPQQPSNASSANHSPDEPQQPPVRLTNETTTSSIKKRRMSLADQHCLLKPTQNHHTRAMHNTWDRHKKKLAADSVTEPISPLVIGFNQPDDPAAMQQVANTIKLREEQKKLIEQRRNSFAGLNSFSSSQNNTNNNNNNNNTSNTRSHQSSSQNNHPHDSPASQTSIPKPANCNDAYSSHNGLMKLLSHPCLPTSPATSKQPSQQAAFDPPPPVVNLPSIDLDASRNHQQHLEAQDSSSHQSSNNNNNGISDPIPSPDMVDVSSPTQSTQNGSSVADRRGQAVREKVKNMAFAPQTLRPQLLVQPSVKSAPIRNGFLQATAPNGEVVKTPLIARTNLAGAGGNSGSNNNAIQPHELHPSRLTKFNPSTLNQSSRLNHSIGPGPSTAFPKLGASELPYRQGIERRMTMHAGSLMQVPTLSHVVPGSNNGFSQSYPSPASLFQLQQANAPEGGLRNCGPGPNTPSQPAYQDPLPPPGSARLRSSVGGSGAGPVGGIPSKQMFLQLFESFYDSLSDSKVLQNNLEEQIRRSAQLLHSLQQSAGVFEAILDERLAAVQTQSTRELQILENRIDLLEARLAPSSQDDELLHPHPLEMAETQDKSLIPNGSPKIPFSTQNSSAKSTSQTSTGGGPRSGTGVEDGQRTG